MEEQGGSGLRSGTTSKLDRLGLSSQSRWFLFFKCALLVWLALFLVEILIIYIQPREYLGRVRLQIQPYSQDYEVFRNNSTKSMLTPTFIQTQFQIITSKETLYDVIEELQLVRKWEDAKSPADAYGLLLNKLETEEVRNTDLIDIEIYHTDPQEAADLANAVGQAYKKRRNETETTRANNALDMLNAQETLQEQKVEDSRQRMIELMEKFNIVDLSDSTSPSADYPKTSTPRTLGDAVAAFHEKRRAAVDLQTQVATIKGLDENMRTQWMLKSDLLSDAVKMAHDESIQLEGQNAIVLASGLASDSDPTVVERKNAIDTKRAIVVRAAADALALLEVEEQIATASLKKYAEMVESLRDDMMNERKSYTQYQEAKSAFIVQRSLLDSMRRALLEEKIDLSLPRNPIEIHENAEPNEVPAKPRVPLQLAMSAGFNLLWCIPGGLIVMYFSMLYTSRAQRMALNPDQIPDAIELSPDEIEMATPDYRKGDDNW